MADTLLEATPSTIQMRLATGNAIAGTPQQLVDLLGENSVAWNNDQDGDEFQIKGNSNSNLFITDVSSDLVGIGDTPDLGVGLHIKTGDTGQTIVANDADELVIEGSTNAGLTILSGSGWTGVISFGDPDSPNTGQMYYDHNGDVFIISSAGDERLRFDGSQTTFNNLKNDTDVEMKGDTNDFVFFMDAGLEIVGISSAGLQPDLGSGLHIKNGDSGVTAPSIVGDELIIENSGNSGLSIYSGTTSTGALFFGDSGSSISGGIEYDHDSDTLHLSASAGFRMSLDSSEVVVNPNGNDTNFRIESDDNINKFLLDAGNNSVGVYANEAATGLISVGGSLFISNGISSTSAVTTEEDLHSYTMPANTLRTDSHGVRVSFMFTTESNTNTKTVRVYFGATVVYQRTTTTSGETMSGQFIVYQAATSFQITTAPAVAIDGGGAGTCISVPTEDQTGR